MPTGMPPSKNSGHPPAVSPALWLTRTLNWTALFLGVALCLWAINNTVNAPSYSNSPSITGASAVYE